MPRNRLAQQGRPEIAGELAGEVDADPGMDPTLAAEIAALVGRREDAVMPDIGVDIEALAAVEPEGVAPGEPADDAP